MKKTPIRYSENPFLQDFKVTTTNKQVHISPLGEDNNIVVNQLTGEFLGGTSVVTYKKVDNAQFIKLFTQNIKLAFNLTQAGQKALFVMFWEIRNHISKDLLTLDQYVLDQFLNENPDLEMSIATFRRGLNELVKAQIIAMAHRRGEYYINPNFAFNGNRVAFTTVLENEDKLPKPHKKIK